MLVREGSVCRKIDRIVAEGGKKEDDREDEEEKKIHKAVPVQN